MIEQPEASAPPRPLVRARTLSRVLDDLIRIPGTSWRVGLDPLLGFVPGVGDWVAWAVALHLLWCAARLGAGPALLARMVVNLVIDAAVGAIPVAGDLFDMGWKANALNLALLEEHVADAHRVRAQSRLRVGAVLAAGVALVLAGAWGALAVLRWTVGLVT